MRQFLVSFEGIIFFYCLLMLLICFVYLVSFSDTHYKDTPKFDSLNKETRDLMINLISINSSYASQVRLHLRLLDMFSFYDL